MNLTPLMAMRVQYFYQCLEGARHVHRG